MTKTITKRQKKDLFLFNYAKSFNKHKAMQGVFTSATLYKYLKDDPEFKAEMRAIENIRIYNAEEGLQNLLDDDDPKIRLATIKFLLSSKLAKEISNYTKAESDPKINIETDKIEYTIND